MLRINVQSRRIAQRMASTMTRTCESVPGPESVKGSNPGITSVAHLAVSVLSFTEVHYAIVHVDATGQPMAQSGDLR